MITNDFAEFVSSQQALSMDDQEPDWNGIVEAWLGDLDGLYKQVIDFLREYIDRGEISYQFTNVALTEEHLGTYTARKMEIRIGRNKLYLTPIGTLFIGCKGRVDLVGSMGRVSFFLVGAGVQGASDLIRVTVTHIDGKQVGVNPETQSTKTWAWKIASHTVPRKLMQLEKNSFLAALMEVANG